MFSIIVGGRLRRGRMNPTRGLDKPVPGSPVLNTGQESSPYKRNSYSIKLKVEGANLEELLVSFLNELLYLSEKEKAIFNEFRIKVKKSKNEFYLKGQIKKNSQVPKREIKAATYHDLKLLQKKDNFWQTRIIFDM